MRPILDLQDLPSVTTARASEIVGLGYEGFRSYLKRGLLGRTGLLPGFHAPGAATSDDPAPRSGWSRHGFASLCLMRLAKLLMDAGFPFETANSIVSQEGLWKALASDTGPVDRFLLVWPPYGDHTLFEPAQLDLLPQRVREIEGIHFTLLNLGDLERDVAARMGAIDLPSLHRAAATAAALPDDSRRAELLSRLEAVRGQGSVAEQARTEELIISLQEPGFDPFSRPPGTTAR